MKGILKLVPIEKPVEGMQYTNGTKILKITDGGYGPSFNPQQIVIEYEIQVPPEALSSIGMGIKTAYLPLHPNDWEKALPLIGKEVEFERSVIPQAGQWITKPLKQEGAKLILPKQEESWDDIQKAYLKTDRSLSLLGWLIKNYQPPKRKR